MKRIVSLTAAISLAICVCAMAEDAKAKSAEVVGKISAAIDANAGIPDGTKKLLKEKVLPLCTNAVLLKETKDQNAKNIALDAIKKDEAAWAAAEDETPLIKEKLNNACAQEVKKALASIPEAVECFVKDKQGASVGQNRLTSSYWHGEKPKFKEAYNEGKGGLYVGKPEFDKSSNAKCQQFGLPIIDADGAAVGTFVIGIKTE